MQSLRVGINGFGRMGRLALRAGWGHGDLEFVHVNELHGDATTAAHLLTFDSVHGRWPRDVRAAGGDRLLVDDATISYGGAATPGDVPWDELVRATRVLAAAPLRSAQPLRPLLRQNQCGGRRRFRTLEKCRTANHAN